MASPFPLGHEMKVEVRYKGPEADRGRMSAIDLGPAIFGFGKVVSEASRILYGDESRVRVEVRADYEHASFGIEFIAVAQADLLTSASLADLANICAVLGFAGTAGVGGYKGLLWIVRRLRGRKIDGVTREGDEVTINVHGDAPFTITFNEYRVFADPEIRKGLKSIVAPLNREGINEVEVKAEDQPAEHITKAELPAFESYPLPEDEVSLDTQTGIVEVISPVFREGNKWKFAQGTATFWAEVADTEFLENVARHGIVFGQGDALRIRMEVRTSRRGAEFEFERRIVKVLEHLPGSQGHQLSLA